MSRGRHSEHEIPEGVGLTALLIARARAVESQRPDRLFDDAFAEDFVAAAGPAFSFYGRPVPPPMEAGAVQLWLASAERS